MSSPAARAAWRLSLAVSASACAFGLPRAAASPPTPAPASPDGVVAKAAPLSGILSAIGNTPLVEIKSLSNATGCRILAKAEHLNPGGSIKDRAALQIVLQAERDGRLRPREARAPGEPAGIIIEGTGGNTGIGMALIAAARGYRARFFMPDNCSPEKVDVMRLLGAEAVVCPAVPFSDENHYYHRAARAARETPHAIWGNQFEGLDNMRAHLTGTGPEIWRQTEGRCDAIALAAGTGGTVGGLTTFLKGVNPQLRVFLGDPASSSLCSYVASGSLTPSAGSTIAEGVGIGRLTANFKEAHVRSIEKAFTVTDQELLDMAYYLLRREGIWVGPSAALNVVAAVKAARVLGPGKTIVTILCDGGERYKSKMYDPNWLKTKGLSVPTIDTVSDHASFVQ